MIDDLALILTPEVGSKTAAHLIECFGSAAEVFAATEAELIEEAQLRPDLARAIAGRKFHKEAQKEAEAIAKMGVGIVAATDGDYPRMLRECEDRPHVLYVDGDREVLTRPMVSFCGTRNATAYGRTAARKLIEGLAQSVPDTVIVSGISYGIEVECLQNAMDCGLQAVAVFAHAIDSIYPAHHASVVRNIIKKRGAVVTEFNLRYKPTASVFMQTNRIIAGISEGTVVVEAPLESGSLTVAEAAYGYQRALMAVPGRLTDTTSAGCNRLINTRKAACVTSAWEILNELGWDNGKKEKGAAAAEIPAEYAGFLEKYFADGLPHTVDEMVGMGGMELAALNTILLNLELSGLLCSRGNTYERP